MKIMSACANGSGTSLMLSRTARKAMEQLGYEITVSEARGTARNYDVVFTSLPFVNMFDEVKQKGGEVIGVKNVMSVPEVKEKIEASDIPNKFKK